MKSFPTRPPIHRLLLWSRPAAVTRTISRVVVDSFKAHPLRWIAHIFEKTREIHPARTHTNATTTVVSVRVVPRVGAAADHCGPHPINLTTGISARVSVLPLVMLTAARFQPTPKVTHSNHSNVPTVAPTTYPTHRPSALRTLIGCRSNNFQLSVPPTDDRYFRRHSIGSFSAVLSGGRPAVTGARCVII